MYHSPSLHSPMQYLLSYWVWGAGSRHDIGPRCTHEDQRIALKVGIMIVATLYIDCLGTSYET